MGKFSRTLPVAVAAALSLLGCGVPELFPAADGDPVPAEVLEFDPQAWGHPQIAALTTEPMRMRVFAGWYGRAEPDDTSGVDRVVPKPGRTLLAVASGSGCRLSTGVAVHRHGDDLKVRFTGGGTGPPNCTRPYGPVALVSVPTAAIEGVRTVNGTPPVAVTGPGVATGFVQLQGGPPTAVEIGGSQAAALTARMERNPDAQAALGRPVRPGTRAFAFVVTGCRDTGAVLLVTNDGMTAEPIDGEGPACYLPEYYLATFEVPADRVPEPALLGG